MNLIVYGLFTFVVNSYLCHCYPFEYINIVNTFSFVSNKLCRVTWWTREQKKESNDPAQMNIENICKYFTNLQFQLIQ